MGTAIRLPARENPWRPSMLATVADRTFEHTTLFLDGGRFVRCRFVDCQLVYEAKDEVDFEDCAFVGCSWTFDGAADRTIGFLATLYQKVGEHGQGLVGGVFEGIRSGRVAEVRVDALVGDPA